MLKHSAAPSDNCNILRITKRPRTNSDVPRADEEHFGRSKAAKAARTSGAMDDDSTRTEMSMSISTGSAAVDKDES